MIEECFYSPLGHFKYKLYSAIPYRHFDIPNLWNVVVLKGRRAIYIPAFGKLAADVAYEAMERYEELLKEEKIVKKKLSAYGNLGDDHLELEDPEVQLKKIKKKYVIVLQKYEDLQESHKTLLGEKMDKKINKIEKGIKKSVDEVKDLKKMDKVQDKKLEKCDKMIKKSK